MPKLPSVFNRNDAEPMQEFDLLPDGWYESQIVKSDIVPTKAGNGTRLNFRFQIISGKYAKRIVFVGLNIDNPNPDAVAISKRELRSICDACDVEELEATEEVHGIPMWTFVTTEKGTNGYKDRNVIKKYRHIDDTPDDASDNPFND